MDVSWIFLRIIGFDNPEPKHNEERYELRYWHILSHTPLDHPFVIIPSRFLCTSKWKVASALEGIIKEGGEGVILQKPKSVYIHGRSSVLAKLKASRTDHEAIVVRIKEDLIEFQTPEGVPFAVPLEDLELSQVPNKGDIVSFSYDTYSRRTAPVNPKIVRIRSDIDWDEVLRTSLNRPSSKVLGIAENPKGHWTERNVRSVLIQFAQSKGLDPFTPQTWYNVSRKSVEEFADGKVALGVFRGGLVKTIMTLFPNIGLDESKFNLKSSYWAEIPNRRSFFVNFAQQAGFDPLFARNWYNISHYKTELMQAHGAKGVLSYYIKSSLVDALVHLFPEIRFHSTQFTSSFQRYYKNEENRKNFFINFSKSKSFDALSPTGWYHVSAHDVKAIKGAQAVLSHYRSLPAALLRLFPNIDLQKSKFSVDSNYTIKKDKVDQQLSENDKFNKLKGGKKTKSNLPIHFCVENSRKIKVCRRGRAFFNSFATTQNFDPLIVQNWYTVSAKLIAEHPGYRGAVKHYNGSWRKALADVYLELLFKLDQFEKYSGGYWLDLGNRRAFLERIAAERGLDPLDGATWSNITYKDICSVRGGTSLLYYYNGNFTKAVQHLFPDSKGR